MVLICLLKISTSLHTKLAAVANLSKRTIFVLQRQQGEVSNNIRLNSKTSIVNKGRHNTKPTKACIKREHQFDDF
jgi:hypothetical protein